MSKNTTKTTTKSTTTTTTFADTLAALRKEQKTLLATFVADRQKLYDDYRLAKAELREKRDAAWKQFNAEKAARKAARKAAAKTAAKSTKKVTKKAATKKAAKKNAKAAK